MNDREMGPIEQELVDRMRETFEHAAGVPFSPDLDLAALPAEVQMQIAAVLPSEAMRSVAILAQYVDQLSARLDALEQ